jgi:hypothetical protein
LGLENEYLAIADLPSRGYKQSFSNAFVYKIDPLEAAYSDIQNEKRRFMKKLGKWGQGFWLTDRGNALYNARLALRYKDEVTAVNYMGKYLEMGGTMQGLAQSLENMDPLSGMTKGRKVRGAYIPGERDMFVASLTETDKLKLVKAYQFYHELLGIGDSDDTDRRR